MKHKLAYMTDRFDSEVARTAYLRMAARMGIAPPWVHFQSNAARQRAWHQLLHQDCLHAGTGPTLSPLIETVVFRLGRFPGHVRDVLRLPKAPEHVIIL